MLKQTVDIWQILFLNHEFIPGEVVFVALSFSFLPSFGSLVCCPLYLHPNAHTYGIYLTFLFFYLFVTISLAKAWGNSVPALIPLYMEFIVSQAIILQR